MNILNQTGCCDEFCCDTIFNQISVSVGIDEFASEINREEILIYPNPAKEKLLKKQVVVQHSKFGCCQASSVGKAEASPERGRISLLCYPE